MCAGLGGFLTLFQQLIADRAIGVAGVTGCRKRCFDRIANLWLVADSRDYFLFNNDFLADITVLAFRQARLGAGRCLCCINHFGMALCRNLSLCDESFVANRAVLALGLARRRAGRLNCRINDLGMTLGGDFFLGNEYSIADGAVLTLGQTSLGAGSRNSRVNDFRVASCRDLFHTGYRSAADGALRTGFMTSLGAGSRLFRNFNRSMSSRVDCFGLGCIANCAGVGLDTGILTGRRGRDLALIPAVALGGDLFLCFDHRSADRAADAIRQTRLGAGRRLARNGLLGVAGRGNHFLRNENLVADGAVLTLSLAGFRAGRLNGRVDDLGVALGLNGFALGDFLAADGADCITGVAILGAGGVLLVDHLGERMIVLPLGIKSGVLRQGDLGTIRIGVASAVGCGVPAREVVTLAGEGVFVQCGIRLCSHGLRSHRAFGRVFRSSVGLKGDGQLDRRTAAPNAINIVDDIASACGRSFRVGVVLIGVVQLGGGDGDLNVLARILVELIGLITCTGRTDLSILASTFTGSDIGTRCRRVNSALNCQHAVYIDLSISNPPGTLSRR